MTSIISTPTRGTITALGLLLAISSAPSIGAAQGESVEAIRRAECAQAVRLIAVGASHPKYEWALGRVSGCSGAADALREQWAAGAPLDTAKLGSLTYATSLVRDRTLLDAMLSIVGNVGRPLPERRASLDVLISYWRPGALAPLLAGSPEQQDVRLCGLGIQTHFEPENGETPLVPDDAERISARLAELGAVEPDDRFRHALLCTWNAMTVVPAP